MNSIGKTLMLLGLALVALGAIFTLGGKLPWFGKLPGDIYVEKKNFTLYFPLATSLLVSALISIALLFLRRR
jgi:membrane protein implicated in regulation of membrane protease activity